MGSWTEIDPNTGVVETCSYDEIEDALRVTRTQDCSALIDRNHELKATRATDVGIKKDIWHYCSVPIGVQYELLQKYGIDITNRNHWPRMFDIINRDYPYLKTTDKVHAFKH